jgi:hypothetical protein
MLEEFKQHAAECLKHVKEKDTETIQYDWFLNSDKTECEICVNYLFPFYENYLPSFKGPNGGRQFFVVTIRLLLWLLVSLGSQNRRISVNYLLSIVGCSY